ncbi:hypothetical protein ABZ931_38550, partial [Streptomyces neyagawaensis]
MSGAAALLGVAALVVSAVPADAATGGDTPPPAPGEVVPGQRTATPALVDDIRERAPAAAAKLDCSDPKQRAAVGKGKNDQPIIACGEEAP